MRRLGLIGISYRTATLKELGRFSIAAERLPDRLPLLQAHCGLREVVFLSTCNRIEMTFVSDEHYSDQTLLSRFVEFFVPEATSDELEALGRAFYVRRGADAAAHLLRVASSLDSMVLGETEILGQVKRAYCLSTECGAVGSVLHLLFSQALKAAKRVHSETALTSRPVSMVSLAIGLIRDHLKRAPGAQVVLVGAGEMTVKTANYLQEHREVSLVFVNRTLERAEELARRYGGEARSLEAFFAAPGAAAVIVSATSAPGPLFSPENLRPLLSAHSVDNPLLLIDLALPRDFDTTFDTLPEVALHDLEALRELAAENQEARARETARAWPLLEHQLEVCKNKLIEQRLGPLVQRLRRGNAGPDAELERLFSGELRHLTDSEKLELQNWAKQLTPSLAAGTSVPMPGDIEGRSSTQHRGTSSKIGSAITFEGACL